MSSPDRVAFARDYVDTLAKTLAALPLDDVARVLEVLEQCRDRGQRLFVAGNGGSAATASHMANDLLAGLSRAGRPGMRAIALCDGAPTLTAIANDESYEAIFERPLEALAERGDVLLVITGSGRSPNILRAVARGSQMGLVTIGFLGKGGGPVRDMLDVAVVVGSDDYGPIEDVHMALDHLITAWLRRRDAEDPADADADAHSDAGPGPGTPA